MDLTKLKNQIEYYFSDSNYAKDKFMNETAIKNKKTIPISIILTFKRMRELGATVESVKEAVEDSKVVSVIDDNLKKIETKEFLEYKMNKNLAKRIVHMSGFPINKNLDEIWEILKEYCKPVRVIMRKDKDKVFKGSCFVEFSNEEDAKNILNVKIEILEENKNDEENIKKIKKESKFLEIISKEEYLKKHLNEKKKDENFIEKVKNDFIQKLYKYECDDTFLFADIKKLVRNCAFVDAKKKILRMKYSDDWTEKQFESDNKKINLIKLTEEEAREYVKDLVIKKVPKKKNK